MKRARLSLHTRLLVAAMVLVTGATDALANDPGAADALFQAGKQLIAEKKYAEACSKFDASYKLDPTLGTLLNLADCYEKAGRIATSWAMWGAAMEQAMREKDPRVDYAKGRREALAPKLPKVIIRVHGMIPGVEIFWDDAKLPPGAFDTEIPAEQLEHKLVVRRDDGVILMEEKVQVLEDRTKTEVKIDIPTLNRAHPRGVSEVPKPVPSSTPTNSQRSVGLVIGGIGAVALLTAGTLELLALAKRNDADNSSACFDKFCTPQGIDAIGTARTYATAGQWIGLGGLVVFSVGATMFFVAPSSSTTPSTTSPRAANVGGPTNPHPRIVSPSAVWLSPWAGPAGGGIVVGGAL